MSIRTRITAALAAAAVITAVSGLVAPTAVADPATDFLSSFDFGSVGPGGTPEVDVQLSNGPYNVYISRATVDDGSSCVVTPGLELPYRMVPNTREQFQVGLSDDARCREPRKFEMSLLLRIDSRGEAQIDISVSGGRVSIECATAAYCQKEAGSQPHRFTVR